MKEQCTVVFNFYDLCHFFSEYDFVFIYGAGKIAHKLFDCIQDYNPDLTFTGCCVSHKQPSDAMDPLPICEFPNIGRPLENCAFILAMTEKFQLEAAKKSVWNRQIVEYYICRKN